MKKSILLVAVLFSMTVMFTSCKEGKKEEVKKEHHEAEGHESHDHDAKVASAEVFQCPMDCEKGKTYAEAGSCAVCKMDLKKQSVDKDTEHAEGCTCKDGGECKCEAGKCQCKAETASVEKECTKCEAGKCTCSDKEMASKEKECTMCAPGKCECKA